MFRVSDFAKFGKVGASCCCHLF